MGLSRRAVVGLGALALLVGGAIAATLWVGPGEVAEVAETLGEGPVQTPDGGLRPIRGTERLILIALDGVGEGVLEEILDAGRMPLLGAMTGSREGDRYEHGYAVPDVLSILPSTTVAAWASVFTGVGVAEHGVAGNEQFDRTERRFLAPAPVSVGSVEQMMEAFNDDLVGRMLKAETLYEKLPPIRSHASLAHVHRGADVFTTPAGLASMAIFGGFMEGAASTEESGARLEGAKALDTASVDALLEAVDRHGLPDLQVIYFPGVDLYTHVIANPIEEQKRYLEEVLDPAIGRVLDRWRRDGALDDTWIVITADHGHTAVLDDDRHSLGPEGEDEPPAVLEALGFSMRPLEIGTPEGPYSAALAYQGAFAYVHLADRSTCDEDRCDWSAPPRFEEDVLEVARAFHEASESGARVPALEDTLDLIFARRPVPPEEAEGPFEVWDGQRLVPVADYLREHPRPDLLDLATRLETMAAGPYGHLVGDVLLLARTGSAAPIEERFYFSPLYRSWHGSPHASDSRVPLLVARAGREGASVERTVRRAIGERRGGWRSHREVTDLVVTLLGGGPSREE